MRQEASPDTSYDEDNVAFARGSRALMHEAWYTEDAPREESTHSSAREAAMGLSMNVGLPALKQGNACSK